MNGYILFGVILGLLIAVIVFLLISWMKPSALTKFSRETSEELAKRGVDTSTFTLEAKQLVADARLTAQELASRLIAASELVKSLHVLVHGREKDAEGVTHYVAPSTYQVTGKPFDDAALARLKDPMQGSKLIP